MMNVYLFVQMELNTIVKKHLSEWPNFLREYIIDIGKFNLGLQKGHGRQNFRPSQTLNCYTFLFIFRPQRWAKHS